MNIKQMSLLIKEKFLNFFRSNETNIEKCELCGKMHDNDSGYSPLNILNGVTACNKCITKSINESKFHFRSHIPGCCTGAPYRHITCNDKTEFLAKLREFCDKKYQLSTAKDNKSILVEVNEKSHWVAGYANINLQEKYGLPFWDDIRKNTND